MRRGGWCSSVIGVMGGSAAASDSFHFFSSDGSRLFLKVFRKGRLSPFTGLSWIHIERTPQ
jgi:hypothetical protein